MHFDVNGHLALSVLLYYKEKFQLDAMHQNYHIGSFFIVTPYQNTIIYTENSSTGYKLLVTLKMMGISGLFEE